jgi:hypothetical protein
VYNDEYAPKPGGFCCFKGHWLAKSTELISLEQITPDMNAGFDEDEAVKMLLSLRDEIWKRERPGPGNNIDDNLDLAIVASLRKERPTENKFAANQVDLDEGLFNDESGFSRRR